MATYLDDDDLEKSMQDDFDKDMTSYSAEHIDSQRQHIQTRRKIEALEEERRLKEELGDYLDSTQW